MSIRIESPAGTPVYDNKIEVNSPFQVLGSAGWFYAGGSSYVTISGEGFDAINDRFGISLDTNGKWYSPPGEPFYINVKTQATIKAVYKFPGAPDKTEMLEIGVGTDPKSTGFDFSSWIPWLLVGGAGIIAVALVLRFRK